MDKTMTNKFMYKPNDDTQNAPSVDYSQWLKRFATQIKEPNNQNSMKVPKNVKITNKKTLS